MPTVYMYHNPDGHHAFATEAERDSALKADIIRAFDMSDVPEQMKGSDLLEDIQVDGVAMAELYGFGESELSSAA